MLANSNKPTEIDIHIYAQPFSLQEWVEKKKVILEHIRTYLNLAYTYIKALGWVIYNRHTGRTMGEYVSTFMPI